MPVISRMPGYDSLLKPTNAQIIAEKLNEKQTKKPPKLYGCLQTPPEFRLTESLLTEFLTRVKAKEQVHCG